jgi:hypothetical protein
MNMPGIYRHAAAGFIIPPRTFSQMVWSSIQGAFSLLQEENRADFIGMLEKGTIQEAVISQATGGPVMMLSLFHDLQNPLFKRSKFDVTEFLVGVAPALENFHNVSGALALELARIKVEAGLNDSSSKGEGVGTIELAAKDDDTITGAAPKGELGTILHDLRFANLSETENRRIKAVMNHDWIATARKDPESLAAQLSRMVTTELFQMHHVSTQTSTIVNTTSQAFREGSCKVNNVALLSARASLFVEQDATKGNDELNVDGPRYVAVKNEYDDTGGMADRKTAIAAQLEVLFDLTQEFSVPPDLVNTLGAESTISKTDGETTVASTIVSVATLEGWLMGGPDDGELRWKLALFRPAYEFPNIENAY